MILSSYHNNSLRIGLNTVLIILLVLTIQSCKKFISVDAPPTSITADNVYQDDATAAAVLTGIYTNISLGNSIGSTTSSYTALPYFTGLSSDELSLYEGVTNVTQLAYYQNSLKVNNLNGSEFWASYYPIVYLANAAIEGLNKSTRLTPSVKQQLLGEAYFIRAFSYFYLTNLYGDVPLALSPDYQKNSKLQKSPADQVYQQIIEDLNLAKSLLSENFLDASILKSSGERLRPNKYAATALLARVYLYTKRYPEAEQMATTVIENKSVYDTVRLNNAFLKNSKETIWAVQPVRGTTAQNTGEGRLFILPAAGPSAGSNPVYLSKRLTDSFESGDLRKVNWINSVKVGSVTYEYPFKYKIGLVNTATQEYIMMLRLGELYLIRAEARANIGTDLAGAAADINIIRKRAGLANTKAVSPSDLLTAIAHERQVELFCEWGHRWLDLKRTEKINQVMSVVTPQKGGSWDSRWALYPIPGTELERNPNLIQNPGYED